MSEEKKDISQNKTDNNTTNNNNITNNNDIEEKSKSKSRSSSHRDSRSNSPKSSNHSFQAHSPVILQNQNTHIHMVNPALILLHHILIQEVKKGGKKLIL